MPKNLGGQTYFTPLSIRPEEAPPPGSFVIDANGMPCSTISLSLNLSARKCFYMIFVSTISLSLNLSARKCFYMIFVCNFSLSNLASNTSSSLDTFLPLLSRPDGTSPLVPHSHLQGSLENDPNVKISSEV